MHICTGQLVYQCSLLTKACHLYHSTHKIMSGVNPPPQKKPKKNKASPKALKVRFQNAELEVSDHVIDATSIFYTAYCMQVHQCIIYVQSMVELNVNTVFTYSTTLTLQARYHTCIEENLQLLKRLCS